MSSGIRQKILFVDDEAHWRDRISASLTAAGFDVLAASDGSEAMFKAGDSSVGLMIVDEDLAGESGIMLTKFLRRNHPDVPAILCTSNGHDAERTLDLVRQGADRCVPKGCMEELILTVARCVS